jgi:hypothetical protein
LSKWTFSRVRRITKTTLIEWIPITTFFTNVGWIIWVWVAVDVNTCSVLFIVPGQTGFASGIVGLECLTIWWDTLQILRAVSISFDTLYAFFLTVNITIYPNACVIFYQDITIFAFTTI